MVTEGEERVDRGQGTPADRAPLDLSLVDLALGEGATTEREQLRAELAADPLAAVEFAETRQLIERMRGVTVEPGPDFAARLDALVRQSEQRQRWRRTSPRAWPQLLAVVAAAAIVFAVLAVTDPLALRRSPTDAGLPPPALASATRSVVPVVPEPMLSTIDRAWDATRRMAPDSRLAEAWDRYQDSAPADRLGQWLSPRNAVALLRLDHELRSSAGLRREALRARGHMVAVEDRVQRLADELASTLLDNAPTEVDELALSVRALIAAGGSHASAIGRGTELLTALLPSLEGGQLATALDALGELAAATGMAEDALREHGRRLVAEVVSVEGETWSRRLPRLLASSTSAAEMAAAGRFLRIAPAFGVDADQAVLVRLWLAAQLQERRDRLNETPEVPTALIYGFGDLLSVAERADLEKRLRSWRPEGLLPDFVALQELAATRDPDCVGYARWQLGLRRICTLATPARLRDRAALCLCLSTSFASNSASLALARVVQG